MASKLVQAPIPTSKRAKIFQPIDALVDLREVIAAKEQITEAKRELTEDSIAEINKALLKLQKGQVIPLCTTGYTSTTISSLPARFQRLTHIGAVYRLTLLC